MVSDRSQERGAPVTLFDVAARAQVSHQTVSRVVNGKKGASRETRERVLQAIAELDYKPNVAARNLASRRSNLIGLITHATNYAGPANIVTLVDQLALEQGYRILLASLSSVTPRILANAIGQLVAHGVEGVLVNIPETYDKTIMQGIPADLPMVLMDAMADGYAPSVMVDHRLGSSLAAEHLISLGHRQIAHIGGLSTWWSGKFRKEGWLDALKRHAYVPGPYVEEEWTAEGGFRAARRLLRNHRGAFTAILAGNDEIALGAISALKSEGLSVPEDISIVGFDGVPSSRYFDPPLTSVRFDFNALVKRSLVRLFNIMHNKADLRDHEMIYAELILRHSTMKLSNT